jgi:hypothetical protein
VRQELSDACAIQFRAADPFPFVAGSYSVGLALWAATGAACFVVAGDLLISHRSAKFLDVGQLLLFATLALFGTLLHPAW